jgi:hypothetical protein
MTAEVPPRRALTGATIVPDLKLQARGLRLRGKLLYWSHYD